MNWIFKQKLAKRSQLIKKCSVLKNFIPSYKIKVMPGGQSSISKCQKSKISCFDHNFVMHSFFLYEFNKRLTPMKGYVAHSKRNSIFKVKVILTDQRPNKVQILPFRTISVLCKAFFPNSLGKVFKLLNIYLKTVLH